MRFSLVQTVAPAVEPVSLVEAKAHLRVTSTDEDTLITSLITAARIHAENETRRQLITSTFALRLDGFPESDEDPILLWRPPIQSVSSVKYTDEDGVLQTWAAASYQVDIYEEPGRILPAYEESYPSTQDILNAVVVTYLNGYGLAVAVPQDIKQAMFLLLGELFERREDAIAGAPITRVPLGVERLLAPYRVVRF